VRFTHRRTRSQLRKNLRVGILEPGASTNVCNDGVRQGLRALGYVENQNLVIEARYAEWKPDRLERFASELAEFKPDAIWTHGLTSVPALKRLPRQFRSFSAFLAIW
jgi:ABC-type uncharacterized transport system substrate-binding protein